MEKFFVFQHSLTGISDLHYYPIDEIITEHRYTQPDSLNFGSELLFKLDKNGEGLMRGYLILDQDTNPKEINSSIEFQRIRFPVAEYLFTIHRGSFNEIATTYQRISNILKEEDLKAVIHPILVFPNGVPDSMDRDTIIELWTATNADFNAETTRSELLREVLPRKRYDFYRW